MQFSGYYGVPHFTVQAEPWDAEPRLEAGDRQLSQASDELRSQGFKTNGRYWARVHEPDEYLEASDVPARLMELVEVDVGAIVDSNLLKHDLDTGLNRDRRGAPRHRRLPNSE